MFIARNCGSRSNREDLVKSLMELMPVDSVSSCLHNFDLGDTSEKLPMMQKYAMYFAFENQRIDDYITEKLWDTFRAGVLPVYFGAPNIKEHVPKHSIVHVDDFASHEELAQHLQEIMSNEELYNSYHAWRYKPLPHWFVAKYNFTHVHSECRVCRWASAKVRGLPWDAAKQQIATVAAAPITPGLSGDSEDILWVIPAFKRAWSLDLVLKSLASQSKILVSKDANSADIDSVLGKYSVEVIEHPWSCSRHPNQFPAKDESLNKDYKGDTYGNPRSPWATCLKHHWWWMMKQAWARKPKRVCVLEDDTVIHPQAFEWLAKNKEGNVKLTPEEIAVPWCMSAKEWQALDPKAFCEHDDYNWDQTIAWMFEHAHKNKAVVPSKALSMHVGDCGGWDAGGRAAKCTLEQIEKTKARVSAWQSKTVQLTSTVKTWLKAHSKANGGWGHPKDREHCLEVAGRPLTTSEKYVVVMPSRRGRHVKTGVVLPYHGRHELLEIMGMQSHPEDLVLVQDTGQEFQGFKNVVHTIKHVSHKPIGKSIMEGYDWLYNNGYDILCNLDSDVLVKDNWLKESIRLLEQYPNDIVSAFNEANHLKHCVVKEFDDHYLKNCGGGIHYCFTRELYKTFVQPILANVEMKGDLNFWDAAIVEHIQAGGKYIIATKPSRIQHIGYTGFKENYESLSSRNKLWQVAPDYVLSDEEITLISHIPELSVLTPKQAADIQTIQTADLFAAIDYNAPENSGPWKQGWDYDYDGRFKDGLTVHVVPHSHNDPGWIQTYHTYYSTQTRHILDTVVVALTEDPRRTFIWAEISYFSLWWDDASPQQKEQAKQLVAEKRLDFVTGGWVMNDEASVTARATRWHLQEGREWLQKTFGITPQYSWAIDPFGHSAGQAQVLKELGYKGMLIQRVHYAVKKQLAQKQQLEFQWQTPAGEIFTHMMPFYSYDGPHTCGPDPSVCCQFDFARINGGYSGCPWHKPAVPITTANVAERSKSWLDQVYKKAMLYRGKKVLIPIGDDFRYQTMDEAHKQFENYQKMFDWIGVHLPSVKVSFSTLTRYFDAAVQTHVPKLQGSFFPYSDRMQDYWTGYFNSRIFYKGYDRLLESLIAAVERICPDEDVHMQKRTLGLFQHHDGITGTAKSLVVQDYYQTMQKAVSELETMLRLNFGSHVIVNPLDQATPTMAPNEIKSWQTAQLCQTIDEMVPQMTVDGHGMITALASQAFHETLVWRSNKPGHGVAGAYLMAVTGQEDVLKPIKHSVCGTSLYTELQTVFEMVTRRARVYKDGTVEILYDVDIHARNNGELWAVYKPEWSAEHLCSDLHGLTWECHVERKDAPLQSKFWPMPTMAWLASASKRMTWTGAQPTGVGLHDGAMVLMLDRRGNKDDARGLGQGITDSRPVMMRFGVVMETEGLKERASEKALSIRNWMLNPEIELV